MSISIIHIIYITIFIHIFLYLLSRTLEFTVISTTLYKIESWDHCFRFVYLVTIATEQILHSEHMAGW